MYECQGTIMEPSCEVDGFTNYMHTWLHDASAWRACGTLPMTRIQQKRVCNDCCAVCGKSFSNARTYIHGSGVRQMRREFDFKGKRDVVIFEDSGPFGCRLISFQWLDLPFHGAEIRGHQARYDWLLKQLMF